MIRWTRTALGAAVAASVISIGDAVFRGVSDAAPPWDSVGGTWWIFAVVGEVVWLTMALLAAVLVLAAQRIDRGSAARRWVRRALAADLAVLAVVGTGSSLTGNGVDVLGIVLGACFVLMFLLGVVLGAMLQPCKGLRLPAALMVAPLALIPLAILADAVVPRWAHPGYAETALYIGLALLARASDVSGTSDQRPPERIAAR